MRPFSTVFRRLTYTLSGLTEIFCLLAHRKPSISAENRNFFKFGGPVQKLGATWAYTTIRRKVSWLARGATISATNHIGHSKTISATAKNHIGHTENQYRPQPYRPKPYRLQNIRRVYLASSCRYFSVSCIDPVRIVNLNVKPRIRPIGRKEAHTSPLL